jgi:hypothetical protein
MKLTLVVAGVVGSSAEEDADADWEAWGSKDPSFGMPSC